jgi:hypothetical protein
MDSHQIGATIEREFPVRIEWLGEKSFMIVFRPGWSSQEADRMRPKISARMKELMSERVISKQSFIDAFTHRPDDAGPMPREELLRRLDIILSTFNEQSTRKSTADALRGALIRLAQAYGDPEVSAKVDKIILQAYE